MIWIQSALSCVWVLLRRRNWEGEAIESAMIALCTKYEEVGDGMGFDKNRDVVTLCCGAMVMGRNVKKDGW